MSFLAVRGLLSEEARQRLIEEEEEEMAAPDQVSIDDINVGYEWKPTLGDIQAQQPGFGQPGAPLGLREGDWVTDDIKQKWKAAHQEAIGRLKGVLKECGCVTAADIDKLGCTGIAAHEKEITSIVIANVDPSDTPLAVTIGRFVRIGLAGSGVGLPCFVPPTRFCLVHQTIGGLQGRQTAYYQDHVPRISRALNRTEQGHMALTEAAIHAKDRDDASDVLAGRALPDGFEEAEESMLAPAATASEEASRRGVAVGAILFVCPDHTAPNWSCRYCVAQMVVEGGYAPELLVEDSVPGHDPVQYKADGHGVEDALANADIKQLRVYVLAASYTRKLARDQ